MKKHNHRQRKKLRLGEFRELGFAASAQFRSQLNDDEREAVLDTFTACIEANGLLAFISLNTGVDAYLISGEPRGSATEAQRESVRLWLESKAEFTDFEVGELSDSWRTRS